LNQSLWIGIINIGTYFHPEIVSYRGSTYRHHCIRHLLPDGFCYLFHVYHGGSKQCRKPDISRMMFFQCSNKLFSLYICSQVNNLPSVALHHHSNQVFTNVVQISFNGSDNECSFFLYLPRKEKG